MTDGPTGLPGRRRPPLRHPPPDPAVPAAGDRRLPRPRRRRPDDLPAVHRPQPRRLPGVRQGARHLLPGDRVPVDDPQLGRSDRVRCCTVPLVLPPRRRRPVRAPRHTSAAADLPEHLRVLLHRLRSGALHVGPEPPPQTAGVSHGRVHLDLHQAAPGVVAAHRPERLHRLHEGRRLRDDSRHGVEHRVESELVVRGVDDRRRGADRVRHQPPLRTRLPAPDWSFTFSVDRHQDRTPVSSSRRTARASTRCSCSRSSRSPR